jgi:hypothetical protein
LLAAFSIETSSAADLESVNANLSAQNAQGGSADLSAVAQRAKAEGVTRHCRKAKAADCALLKSALRAN